MQDKIIVKGARVHNLKNINVEIPRNKLVVITGLSGSGKSSLAFDTIYAEGQRRYVESLSSYARQFLERQDKPDVDEIDGLSPAISIDQKSASHNPRSTVGTVTEIYDYLRLLFSRIGHPHCPKCGDEISRQTIDQIVDKISSLPPLTKILLLAPVIRDKKGEHKHLLAEIEKAGYSRVRFDGKIYPVEETLEMEVAKGKKHSLEVIVDRLQISKKEGFKRSRLADSVEIALDLGNGLVIIHRLDLKQDLLFSQYFSCPRCEINLPELEPRNFSFNSPHGACPVCSGLGTKLEVDPEAVIPNKNLTLAQGAIRPWSRSSANQTWYWRILKAVANSHGFSPDVPIKELSLGELKVILYGTGSRRYLMDWSSDSFNGDFSTTFEGVIPNLERRYGETDSDYIRREIEQYMRILKCPSCQGKRLKKEALAVRVGDLTIDKVVGMTIEKAKGFFQLLSHSVKSSLTNKERKIAQQILKEIKGRLIFLDNVGLDYLTLDRAAQSLAGGEAQRIRLATQIGSGLSGVIYILDEPTIGLHPRDTSRLIQTLKNLRDLGNTVIVVEHDPKTILSADWVIDIGPGAGEEGGRIVAQGSPEEIKKNKNSLTGLYLSGRLKIKTSSTYRKGNGKYLVIKEAQEFNLKKIEVEIPLGKFVCITGVSGSGKSTLLNEILAKALLKKFHRAREVPGKHKAILGVENLDKVILIDQSPIGRTPRSNPATYTGAFTPIRELFSKLSEAKIRGYKPGRFSFNVRGGRCEACRGEGLVKIEMQFLPDVYIECEECQGTRYNREAREIHYKGKNISQVLEMSVEEAREFFANIPAIYQKLKTLSEVGLTYIRLGQPATTLSGGEAQRVKLSDELSRRATGKTLYILDEPTTGLHFDDTKRLLSVLNKIVDKGNTVLIIEHNLDVIKSADWIIDLGPEGGERGGYLVACGTPREVAKVRKSYTGQYLKKILKATKSK